jgi:hypothetical protein
VRSPHPGIALNEYYEDDGEVVFQHACKLGWEVSVAPPSDDYGLYKSSGRDIRRNSPRLTPPMMFAGVRPADNQNIAIHLLLLSACPADHLGPTVKSRKGWPLQAP